MTYLRIKSFKVAYTVLIFSAILVFTVGEVYFNYAMNEQESNYNLIEVTGRQRTNSFLINKQLIDGVANETQKRTVDSIVNCLVIIHHSLRSGSDSLGIPVMEEGIFPCYDSLDLAVKAYISAIKAVEDNGGLNNKVPLLEKRSQFIVCVNNLVDAFKNDNEKDYNRFRRTSWFIHLLGVAILLLEFLLIFIPMIQRIQRHNAKLTDIVFNQSHIIRHPLTNIMGLLQLIDKSKLDERQATYISLMDQEARELDKVIRESVSTLSKELNDN